MWEKWFACTDHICCSPSAPSSAPSNVLWWLSNEQSELSWCAWRWLLFSVLWRFCPVHSFFGICNDTWFSTFSNSCDLACKTLILHSNISEGNENCVFNLYGWFNHFCSIQIKGEMMILLPTQRSLRVLFFYCNGSKLGRRSSVVPQSMAKHTAALYVIGQLEYLLPIPQSLLSDCIATALWLCWQLASASLCCISSSIDINLLSWCADFFNYLHYANSRKIFWCLKCYFYFLFL